MQTEKHCQQHCHSNMYTSTYSTNYTKSKTAYLHVLKFKSKNIHCTVYTMQCQVLACVLFLLKTNTVYDFLGMQLLESA